MQSLKESYQTNYIDFEYIDEEIEAFKKTCRSHKWPLIDITHKSIEEAAAYIITKWELQKEYKENNEQI